MNALFEAIVKRRSSQDAVQPLATHEQPTPCAECGMLVRRGEYHPYAACLMYKACGNPVTVRTNLDSVRETVVMEAEEQVKGSIDGFPLILLGKTRGGRAVVAIRAAGKRNGYRGFILIQERQFAHFMFWPENGRLDSEKETSRDLMVERLRALTSGALKKAAGE